MKKPVPLIEWCVARDDADWQRLCAQPLPDPTPAGSPVRRDHRWAQPCLWVTVLLLLLASAGGWRWRSAHAGLGQDEANPGATIQRASVAAQDSGSLVASSGSDPIGLSWQLLYRSQVDALRTAIQSADPQVQVEVPLESLEFQSDLAIAKVIVFDNGGRPSYRQVRFYRRLASGWQPTAPDAALWGPEQSLATPSFIFRFRRHDAPAVIAVAPQMETLYTTLRRDFGLPLTSGAKKLVIEVSVTQPPGHVLPWVHVPDPIIVPSPAIYRAPVDLSEADLLAQSLALPLLAQVSAQASAQHQIGAAWQPLLKGLYLWQVWDLDLPLSIWREEVVKWIYLDLPATRSGEAVVLPEHYPALCAAHNLWLPTPMQMNIPLLCSKLYQETGFFASPGRRAPLTRLAQLAMPTTSYEYLGDSSDAYRLSHPSQTVALATLVEYTVACFGRERLPALLAGLGQYESWDTLLPAVFGVSATEFEAGWQDYLRTRYGIRGF